MVTACLNPSVQLTAGGHYSLIFVIRASLETFDQGMHVAAKMERILSWSLLTTTPSAVLETVYGQSNNDIDSKPLRTD